MSNFKKCEECGTNKVKTFIDLNGCYYCDDCWEACANATEEDEISLYDCFD